MPVGVNFIDTYFRMGMYPSPVGMPFVSGNEGAGEVIAVGPGVTDLKVGDRVGYVAPLGAYAAERLLPADRAREAPGLHQLRAGRRHDAQGHDGRSICCGGPTRCRRATTCSSMPPPAASA